MISPFDNPRDFYAFQFWHAAGLMGWWRRLGVSFDKTLDLIAEHKGVFAVLGWLLVNLTIVVDSLRWRLFIIRAVFGRGIGFNGVRPGLRVFDWE